MNKPVNLRTPEYRAWYAMLTRCRNKNVRCFADYGGRGITVCARWLKFANFLADMGPKPSREHSVNRRDNNGDYEPSNCHWATPMEQARNKRNNRELTAFGETLHVMEWSRRTGLHVQTILWRLRRGWTVEKSLSKDDHRKYAAHQRDKGGRYTNR